MLNNNIDEQVILEGCVRDLENLLFNFRLSRCNVENVIELI